MKRTIKLILCLLTVFSVCFACFPVAYATQEDMVFQMPFQKPTQDKYHGYLELLWQNSDGTYWAEVLTYDITDIYSPDTADYGNETNVYLSLEYSIGSSSNDNIKITFSTTDVNGVFLALISRFHEANVSFREISFNGQNNDYVYSFNGYGSGTKLASIHFYGDFQFITANTSSIPKFTITYANESVDYDKDLDIISLLREIILEAQKLHVDNTVTHDKFDKLIEISQIIGREVVAMGDDINVIRNSCLTILDYLSDISSFCSFYFPEFNQYLLKIYNQLVYVNQHLTTIEGDVASILEILQMQGESNITQVDGSNVNNALDIENSLLNNSNVNVSDVIQVDINQNALTVIWGLVEDVLNTNGKIFGCVLTVISLGIVAMILGRKV